MIDTFAIQINGRTKLIMKGELRGPEDRLGPGGSFIVIAPAVAQFEDPNVGDRVFLIALPDAQKTSAPNPDRREQEKNELR